MVVLLRMLMLMFVDDMMVLEDQATSPAAGQEFDFLGIQFLNQELENFEYETKNSQVH